MHARRIVNDRKTSGSSWHDGEHPVVVEVSPFAHADGDWETWPWTEGPRTNKDSGDKGDFSDDLNGLAEQLVLETAYRAAAEYGQDAIPDNTKPIDVDALASQHMAFREKYANQVPGRIDAALTDFVREAAAGPTVDQATLYQSIDDKLDALGSDVTRYADGPWATGQAGYGNALGEWDVKMLWVLEDGAEHCDTCPDLAQQSEDAGGWSSDDVPTFPGMGDTPCLDRCKCSLTAEQSSWDDAFS